MKHETIIALKIFRIAISGLLLCISFHLLKFAVVQAFAQLAETGLLYGNRLLDRAGDPREIVWLHPVSCRLASSSLLLCERQE